MKSVAEIKTSILQTIADCDDERLLLEIESFIKDLKSSQSEVVGYTSAGKPLTVKDYQASIAGAHPHPEVTALLAVTCRPLS